MLSSTGYLLVQYTGWDNSQSVGLRGVRAAVPAGPSFPLKELASP